MQTEPQSYFLFRFRKLFIEEVNKIFEPKMKPAKFIQGPSIKDIRNQEESRIFRNLWCVRTDKMGELVRTFCGQFFRTSFMDGYKIRLLESFT